eukprot:1096528-Amorphochlora_amoeboformis.AAC.2
MTDMEAYMDELKLENYGPVASRVLYLTFNILVLLYTPVESKCERMKRYAEDIEEMRQTFKFQLNTIPPNIRNMTLKTFAETYKGKVMDVLKEDLVKKQKELDTWVKQTPRLGKNAKVANVHWMNRRRPFGRVTNCVLLARQVEESAEALGSPEESTLQGCPPRYARVDYCK